MIGHWIKCQGVKLASPLPSPLEQRCYNGVILLFVREREKPCLVVAVMAPGWCTAACRVWTKSLIFGKAVIEGGGRRDTEGVEAAVSFHLLLLNITKGPTFLTVCLHPRDSVSVCAR